MSQVHISIYVRIQKLSKDCTIIMRKPCLQRSHILSKNFCKNKILGVRSVTRRVPPHKFILWLTLTKKPTWIFVTKISKSEPFCIEAMFIFSKTLMKSCVFLYKCWNALWKNVVSKYVIISELVFWGTSNLKVGGRTTISGLSSSTASVISG